jgi:selenocysteine-specific elongation factor
MSSSGDRTSTSNNDTSDQGKILNVNVGVLGHVDSGKTSLVKTLSTMLSTAALDKSKESRERGMTLDLGFS